MKNNGWQDALRKVVNQADDQQAAVQEIREFIHRELSTVNSQPIDYVRWVPIAEVSPNDYNPNSVAGSEMRLLYTSILHDGYTQPIVTIRDEEKGLYVIVDGFHRYYTAFTNPDILARNKGMVPIVVIDKGINDRMASTVRHNRARGKHSVKGMANMVFSMLENGWSDADICGEIGMEPEEVIRIKAVTGFARLFSDVQYKAAWETRRQIKVRLDYEKGHAASPVGGAAQQEATKTAVSAAPRVRTRSRVKPA